MHDMLNIHSFSDIMPTGIPYPKTKCTLPNWCVCVCVWIISIDIYLIKLLTTGTIDCLQKSYSSFYIQTFQADLTFTGN